MPPFSPKEHKDNGYDLKSLPEVEKYINENKHLPDVPFASDVKKDRLNLADMDAVLLNKIEELTLYIIDLKKENEQLKDRVTKIENK